MKKWLFLLIIVILLLGTFAFFAYQYDFGKEVAKTIAETLTGKQKLEFPNEISNYVLKENNQLNETCISASSAEMSNLNLSDSFCAKPQSLMYDNGIETVQVQIVSFSKGEQVYKNAIEQIANKTLINGIEYMIVDKALLWYSGNKIVAVRAYKKVPNPDGSYGVSYNQNVEDNLVASWILGKYPPEA